LLGVLDISLVLCPFPTNYFDFNTAAFVSNQKSYKFLNKNEAKVTLKLQQLK